MAFPHYVSNSDNSSLYDCTSVKAECIFLQCEMHLGVRDGCNDL